MQVYVVCHQIELQKCDSTNDDNFNTSLQQKASYMKLLFSNIYPKSWQLTARRKKLSGPLAIFQILVK